MSSEPSDKRMGATSKKGDTHPCSIGDQEGMMPQAREPPMKAGTVVASAKDVPAPRL